MSILALVAAGVAAGSVHVVSGPDHLAAVLPLAVADRRRAARVGLWWGLGHGGGVVALGAVGQLLAGQVEVAAWSALSERLVGVLLVVVGLWAIRRGRLVTMHAHAHQHDEAGHVHSHVHVADRTVAEADHAERGSHEAHGHSAFGFGLVHGAAGAGHLFGVLPSLVMSPADAAVYLAAYVGSAVVSMTLFSAGAAALVRGPRLVPRALGVSGALSVVVGLGWLVAA